VGCVQLFRGRCGVRFYDLQPGFDPGPSGHATPGEFEQQVTIDDLFHERIDVPSIGDTRRATVLHDFSRVRSHLAAARCLSAVFCRYGGMFFGTAATLGIS